MYLKLIILSHPEWIQSLCIVRCKYFMILNRSQYFELVSNIPCNINMFKRNLNYMFEKWPSLFILNKKKEPYNSSNTFCITITKSLSVISELNHHYLYWNRCTYVSLLHLWLHKISKTWPVLQIKIINNYRDLNGKYLFTQESYKLQK